MREGEKATPSPSARRNQFFNPPNILCKIYAKCHFDSFLTPSRSNQRDSSLWNNEYNWYGTS